MTGFIAGLVTMGFAVGGAFFLRFWSRTGDSLFLIFAIAFWLLALNQGLAAVYEYGREELGLVYLLRVAAFVLIIAGIVAKNVRAGRPE